MGNTNLSQIIGKGDIYLKTMNGTKLILKDFRHIPDMRLNLISVDKLDNEGFFSTFGNDKWKLTKGSMVVARGEKQSKLYMTQAKLSKEVVNMVENENKVELWHRRLGHMSEKSMIKLVKKNVLSELD